MKKCAVLIIGMAGLIVSFIWMLLSQSSTGWFLLLASMSGAAIGRGIAIIKNTRN